MRVLVVFTHSAKPGLTVRNYSTEVSRPVDEEETVMSMSSLPPEGVTCLSVFTFGCELLTLESAACNPVEKSSDAA